MIKGDLHVHCGGDPYDKWIEFSAYDYIHQAISEGTQVISFTTHFEVFKSKKVSEFARQRGILLIPGAEVLIEGREALLYNFSQTEIDSIKTFSDLRSKKKENHLVIAPHPFYPAGKTLRGKLVENIDLFDAIEYNYCFSKWLNFFNKKAEKIALKYDLPMVGGSDRHWLYRHSETCMIFEKMPGDSDEAVAMIKAGRITCHAVPLGLVELIRTCLWALIPQGYLSKRVKNISYDY